MCVCVCFFLFNIYKTRCGTFCVKVRIHTYLLFISTTTTTTTSKTGAKACPAYTIYICIEMFLFKLQDFLCIFQHFLGIAIQHTLIVLGKCVLVKIVNVSMYVWECVWNHIVYKRFGCNNFYIFVFALLNFYGWIRTSIYGREEGNKRAYIFFQLLNCNVSQCVNVFASQETEEIEEPLYANYF